MTLLKLESVTWPADEAIATHRVLNGAPVASTLTLHDDSESELGMWRVTEGEFTTLHQGYTEFITILQGSGKLIHDDGTVLDLAPGTVAVLKDGWSGRWVIEEALTKSYAIVPVPHA